MSNSQPDSSIQHLGPLGVLILSIVLGGFGLVNFTFEGSQLYVYTALLVVSALGILYVGWNFRSIQAESGTGEALSWIFNALQEETSGSKSGLVNEETEKTPPAPEPLKNELYFERANRQCEWCDQRIDTPEVHHITPRAEGGQNTLTNLIVLCPNCHAKADGGTISRSRLKYRVREQMENMEGDLR